MNATPEVSRELDRANESLRAATLLLDEMLLADSLSRAYYAVLHAARAALLAKGIRADTHEAVKRLFGLHLVKSGDVPQEFGIVLRKEQDDRLLADYDVAFVPEKERVELRCTEARDFVRTVCDLIGRQS